ncbi:MAG: hypothetical protein ACI4XD_04645 [Clostridia bacterium]
MKKIIYNTLIILYAIIAIVVTICLLSFNQYKVSEFDSTTLLIINTNNLKEKGFSKGDLVFVDTTQKQELGEDIFFHATSELGKTTIDIQKLKDKQTSVVTGEVTYVLEDKEIPSNLAIGPTKNSTRIAKLGTILSILESKWGFLILIVFPSLLAFLYELWEFIANVRAASKEDEEEDEEEDDEKEEEVIEKKKTTKTEVTTATKEASNSKSKTTKTAKKTTGVEKTTKPSTRAKNTTNSSTRTTKTTTKPKTTKAKE